MAKISQGKWACEWSACKECGTTAIKHKGRGLCLRCFDKDRDKNPNRKAVKLKASRKYCKKNKYNIKFREKNNARQKEWKKEKYKKDLEYREKVNARNRVYKEEVKHILKYKKTHLLNNRKQREKQQFIKFINGEKKNKWKAGLTYICNGCNKQCKIISPVQFKNVKHELEILKRFKKVFINNCKKK